MKNRAVFPLGFVLAPALLLAATVAADDYPEAARQTLDLSKQAITLRSVRGEGNETVKVAELFRDALVAGGWSQEDVEIVPFEDTAYLIATWPGSDPSLGPVVISAHMDVVEARPEDWQRDPFTPVVENGYLFGRGASDIKFGASLALSAMIELRRQGFMPRRSIVVAYSGDEETTMATSRVDRPTTEARGHRAQCRRGWRSTVRGDRRADCVELAGRGEDLCGLPARGEQPRWSQFATQARQCDCPALAGTHENRRLSFQARNQPDHPRLPRRSSQ